MRHYCSSSFKSSLHELGSSWTQCKSWISSSCWCTYHTHIMTNLDLAASVESCSTPQRNRHAKCTEHAECAIHAEFAKHADHTECPTHEYVEEVDDEHTDMV
ncbi:hypothetical protein BC628DRAFT_746771 [Trametes gibbosa]|nr:hypothetical protein BC628DRAFT_746771 [Trametes gibbosa]